MTSSLCGTSPILLCIAKSFHFALPSRFCSNLRWSSCFCLDITRSCTERWVETCSVICAFPGWDNFLGRQCLDTLVNCFWLSHGDPSPFTSNFGSMRLWQRGKRAWIWVIGIILCDDVPATYLAGLGLSVFWAGKGWKRSGSKVLFSAIGLCAIGAGWLAFMSGIGDDQGSGLVGGYSYITAAGATPT